MAFQQPQRQPAARQTTYTPPEQHVAPAPILTARRPSLDDDQHEWVLFSPAAFSATNTQSGSTARTTWTPGRSRLSDFGSLDTAARSEQPVVTAEHADDDVGDENEAEDLDSLDDGLHAFHEPPTSDAIWRSVEPSTETILPHHDGLGTFPADSLPVQDRLWQFERFNPRRPRHLRRRSSLTRQLDAVEEADPQQTPHNDRFQRIEQWRLDQSRALLEEVEKETRRKRRQAHARTSSTARSHHTHTRRSSDLSAQPAVSFSVAPASEPDVETTPPAETFWQRLTRRVIRDLMGLDDATLSMIFGESVASTTSQSAPAVMSPIVQATATVTAEEVRAAEMRETESWSGRLLERIATELGVLVHQLSEHPGAFSTYLRSASEPLDYAGLPTPSEFTTQTPTTHFARPAPAPHFRPTLARPADPSLWGIEEEEEEDTSPAANTQEMDAQLQREREYWERDLDVKMVFGFIRNRFSSDSPSPSARTAGTFRANASTSTARTANVTRAGADSAESLRRAALIRHHHPLVSSARRASLQQRPPPSPILGRRASEAASSCASQSSKRSRTGRSGSSRNYWDIGAGSVGSVGWGEV